jgi:DNA-binding response OmpR family regulator
LLPGKPKILIVEDEPALAALLARALIGGGFDVRVCHTGIEALSLDGAQFQAAVVDLSLPDLNGEEVVRRLKSCPVVVSSGTPVASGYFGTRQPPVTILQKPYLPNRLLDEIRRLLAA